MHRLTYQRAVFGPIPLADDAEELLPDPFTDRYTEGVALFTHQPSGCARTEVSKVYEIAL